MCTLTVVFRICCFYQLFLILNKWHGSSTNTIRVNNIKISIHFSTGNVFKTQFSIWHLIHIFDQFKMKKKLPVQFYNIIY